MNIACVHAAHLTDHDRVHEIVQGQVQRCSRKVSFLTGTLAVGIAPPGQHSVVLIIPLEESSPDLHQSHRDILGVY